MLGSFLVSRLGLAGLSRANVPEDQRADFHVYLDEFQGFTTASLPTMLSELRKYRVGLVLAHQFLGQLDRTLRDAVLGNVGTLIAFRVGPEDAEVLEREFRSEFSASDLVRLPNYAIYVRLLVDGRVTAPFSGVTVGS